MAFPSLRAPRISPAVFVENRRLRRGGLRVRRDGLRISAQSLPFPLKTWGPLIDLSFGPRFSRAARCRGRRADGGRRADVGRFRRTIPCYARRLGFPSGLLEFCANSVHFVHVQNVHLRCAQKAFPNRGEIASKGWRGLSERTGSLP